MLDVLLQNEPGVLLCLLNQLIQPLLARSSIILDYWPPSITSYSVFAICLFWFLGIDRRLTEDLIGHFLPLLSLSRQPPSLSGEHVFYWGVRGCLASSARCSAVGF